MEPALIVPAERAAVGSEPLVQLGSYEKQKFPCRCPLLGGHVERRSPVSFRDDGAAASIVSPGLSTPGTRETGSHQGSRVRPVAARQPSIRWGRYWIFFSLRLTMRTRPSRSAAAKLTMPA